MNQESSPSPLPEPLCVGCNRGADAFPEYDIHREKEDGTIDETISRADVIRREEGTYNKENGHFLCDVCYIKAGMPSSDRGWVAP